MKEKTKKVIKSLGIGALLCAGAFTFAGCSLNAEDKALVENKVAQLEQQLQLQSDFLESQKDLLELQNNLINQLKQKETETNEKLDEQNDLIEDQNELINQLKEKETETNAKLDEQNDLLEQQSNLLKEQNNLINQQLLVDRAWGLIQTAQAKLLMNIDGVRDNLIMEQTLGQETSIQEFYKTTSGDYVFAQNNHVVYEDNSGIYSYRHNDKEAFYEKVELSDYNCMEVYFVEELNSFNFVGDATKENITSIEILNNGDYKIKIVYNRIKELEYTSQQVSTILELVISSDGKCVSAHQSNINIQKWEGNDDEADETAAWISKDLIVKFKYGEVNVEEVLSKLVEAKACPVK